MNIIEAMSDPAIFCNIFAGHNWAVWRIALKAIFAIPMTSAEADIYRELTGRDTPPSTAAKEAWLVCGRRSGKSFIMALIAVYLATFRDYRQFLAPGEVATIFIVAADKKQARTTLRYVKGLLEIPMLAALVEKSTEMGVELSGHVAIEVATCSSKTIRGYTLAAAICDEAAFWQDETSVEPDREVLTALRPSLATIPDALLLVASSPYARKGILWDAYQRHFRRDGDPVLVLQAPTLRMNPTVPASVIADARIADPQSAAAEYDAQFRTDVETFISREAIDLCTSRGVLERPPVEGTHYVAFVDPSGGMSDAMVLAVAHVEKDGTAVLDCTITRQPPFSPEQVVADFTVFLKRYRCTRVTGDHFGGEWPREQFRKQGITYEVSARTKRDIYLGVLPLINSGKADLLDNPKLASEFCALERRQSRGGREVIDHPLNAHDDLVNAVAGALIMANSTGNKSWIAHIAPISITRPTDGAGHIYEGGSDTSAGIVLSPWPSSFPGA